MRVLVHRAVFLPTSPEHYVIKVTNLSARREIEITHLWFATNPPAHILNPHRPLPARLRLDETFETWAPVADVEGTGIQARQDQLSVVDATQPQSRRLHL